MNKIKLSLINFILLFIVFEIILNSILIKDAVLYSFNFFIGSIFPILFPMMIVVRLLINYGFADFLAMVFRKPINFLFKAHPLGGFVFIVSLLSGAPAGAKYIKDLYDKNRVTDKEASKLLVISHFISPLFIVLIIGKFFLGSLHLGYFILFIHIISSIIVGILFRNYNVFNGKVSSLKVKKEKFSLAFYKIVSSTIDTMMMIFCIITIFFILIVLFNNIFNLPLVFSGFLEISHGSKALSLLDISLYLKTTLMCTILAFGGFSIHLQVLSIISTTKIKYLPFFIGRILQGIISLVLSLILFNYFF